MELTELKQYLRIDFDDDDSLLRMLMGAARKYIHDAVGYQPDESDERVKLLISVLVADWYEHREYTVNTNGKQSISQKVQYTVRSIVLQLQFREDLSDED